MKTDISNKFEERFIDFGISVIKLTQKHKSSLPFSVIDQVIRASTSIGANYSEAQNASSKADFKNKLYISKKEAAETRYWLRIISRLIEKEDVEPVLTECHELLMILQKTISTLNSKNVK